MEILALDENATLLLLFHARTHGSESVWCHVVRLSVLVLPVLVVTSVKNLFLIGFVLKI